MSAKLMLKHKVKKQQFGFSQVGATLTLVNGG